MVNVENFAQCLSVGLFDKQTKDQLLRIAKYYEVSLPKQGRKEVIVTTCQLGQLEVLPALAIFGLKGGVLATREAAAGPLKSCCCSISKIKRMRN